MKFLGGSLCIIVISSANNDPSIEILIRSNLDDRSRKVNTSVNNFSLSLSLFFFFFLIVFIQSRVVARVLCTTLLTTRCSRGQRMYLIEESIKYMGC